MSSPRRGVFSPGDSSHSPLSRGGIASPSIGIKERKNGRNQNKRNISYDKLGNIALGVNDINNIRPEQKEAEFFERASKKTLTGRSSQTGADIL
jgi:hypothetical protein